MLRLIGYMGVISWLRITRVMPKLLRLLCYTGIPIGFKV